MRLIALLLTFALLLGAPPAAAQEKVVPYWASIAAGQARMRTGPGRNFPASWLYRRPGLPVRVVATVPSWRKVTDPSGTSGWMLAALLDEKRTAIVTGGTRPLRAAPKRDARILWQAEAGVVGGISECADGWCLFETRGGRGYVEVAHIWGVGADEVVE